jgi:hypothetical protein
VSCRLSYLVCKLMIRAQKNPSSCFFKTYKSMIHRVIYQTFLIIFFPGIRIRRTWIKAIIINPLKKNLKVRQQGSISSICPRFSSYLWNLFNHKRRLKMIGRSKICTRTSHYYLMTYFWSSSMIRINPTTKTVSQSSGFRYTRPSVI